MNTPKPLKVLIVDDNPVERALLAGLLKKIKPWKIAVTTCSNGSQVMQCVDDTPVDVAFVDFRLRGETGTDLIRALREKGSRTGFILFTGTTGDEALLEALRSGADDYIRKTELSIDAISRVLRHTLEKVDNSRALEEALEAVSASKIHLEERVAARTSQLREAQKRLDTITSTAHDPIIMLDQDAKVIFWNPAAERLFGYSEEEIMGKEVFCLLPESHFKKRIIESFASYRLDGKGAMVGEISEFTVISKSNKTFFVGASLSPIQSPDGWHTVVIPRDITRRRENEQALKRAKEEAEGATRLKDKFVSLVAHDLRGPFTTILGFLQLMERDKKHPLSKKQKGYVRWISESSQKMLRMIDEILNISRLKTGKITPRFRFLNARVLCDRHLSNLAPLAQKKGVSLINDVPETLRIYADPDLFGEVIHNLLSNAIKFTKKGNTVRLLQPSNDMNGVAVQDDGVGIRKKRLAKLFDLEEKTSTTGTAGEHGTGFGLPFSRDLMVAHNGELTVESKEGEGSTFTAKLPEVVPRVLVIDDDPDIRKLLLKDLYKKQAVVDEASSTIAGLKMLTKNRYHLIICDVQMPKMDGFEFLKFLRGDPATKQIPAILVTADKSIETREKAFQSGADDFLTKPILSRDFVPRIRRILG
ncbi:MAG: response regulator [Magnetococcales bacterium]|nr:response regulator [Magnetococcales bacterium]